MAKKAAGLGRGLGELLEDNTPVISRGGTVIRRDETGTVSVTNPTPAPVKNSGVEIRPKGLYDGLPKTNSIKANFKNFK